jgi:hypothetical protein
MYAEQTTRRSAVLRSARGPALVAVLLGLAACVHRPAPPPPSEPGQFSNEVRRLLQADRPTREYYEALARLEAMGPEVDAVLVTLARDARARPVARANALILLAERGSPAALEVLAQALLSEEVEMLRSAAVLGLQRLAPASDTAASLIRSAVADPARNVRLNALQALDIREVETIRALLETEPDREVRTVAVQLVSLAENRGARLAPDRRGALRTAGMEDDPAIVFRATRVDEAGDVAVGDLRVEVPDGPDILLGPAVEVVAGVVPAFFSPDRSQVVYEVDRAVRIVDLASRQSRVVGAGIAPRVVPFSRQFVFLRERPELRGEAGDGTRLLYEVLRAEFGGGEPVVIGTTEAIASMERHLNYSPARWMVVAETREGFALRAAGMPDFLLPPPGRMIASPPPSSNPAPAAQPDQR